MRRRTRVIVGQILILFTVFGVAWAVTNPYGASPDEQAQYVRALGVSGGDFAGRPAIWVDVPLAPIQQRFIDSATRRFRVPARLAPRGSTLPCFAFHAERSASCLQTPTGRIFDSTYVGVYPPLPYLVPGLAARTAHSPLSGLLLARLFNGLTCLAVLVACVFAVVDDDYPALSLVGIALSLPPTVLFFAWSMNPNGLEMMAGSAFVAICLRLTRPHPVPPRIWAATGFVGAVTVCSRPISLVWVFFALFVAALVVPVRVIRRRISTGGRPAAIAGGVILVSIVATVGWNLALHARAAGDPASLGALVHPVLLQFRDFLPQHIGVFGWGEVVLPNVVYRVWEILLVALGLVALFAGSWRQRLGTPLLLVAYFIGNLVLTKVAHGSGFPSGGRYVQPAFAAFPLFWTEVIVQQRERVARWARGAAVAATGGVVWSVNVIALLYNARRNAVGAGGDWSFLTGRGGWKPAGGWPMWEAVVVVTSLALAGAVVAGLPRRTNAMPGDLGAPEHRAMASPPVGPE